MIKVSRNRRKVKVGRGGGWSGDSVWREGVPFGGGRIGPGEEGALGRGGKATRVVPRGVNFLRRTNNTRSR